MTISPSFSLRAACATLCVFLLVACQNGGTQSTSTRAIALLTVVEEQNGCAIPLERTRKIFTSAGFSSAQERIDLIWELRTKTGKLSVFDARLEANTRKCDRPPAYLSASKARFLIVQDFFLGRDCTTTDAEIQQTFKSTDISPYEFASYSQILLAAGALEIEGRKFVRKDWGNCAVR